MPSTVSLTDLSFPITSLAPSFTPHESCLQNVYFIPFEHYSCGEVACRYFHLGAPDSTSECFPSGWSSDPDFYISPGACPKGYTIACASAIDQQTVATCCPREYSCLKEYNYDYLTTDRCVRDIPSTLPLIYTTSTYGGSAHEATTSGADQAILAYGLEVRWNSSDLLTATLTLTSTSGVETSRTSTGAEDPGSNNFSTGAKAGIGAGVPIFVLLLLLGIGLFWHRRKTRKSLATTIHPTGLGTKEPTEVHGSHISELPGHL